MRTIEVVAAVICRENKVFATQRGYGEFKDWWEFPGGKIEIGETSKEALKREIREELHTEISVDKFLTTVEYDYPKFHLVMYCYICHVIKGELELVEAEDARWLGEENLDVVNWLPADMMVVKEITRLRLC
jgi:8-oxo-dGTP diphosphatase